MLQDPNIQKERVKLARQQEDRRMRQKSAMVSHVVRFRFSSMSLLDSSPVGIANIFMEGAMAFTL